MIEEPYRWMEAVANRREYIEHELASGSPIAALSYAGGILFFTLSRERQKIFEIYDRIALGGLGHPGDIERLRMATIEVASTEGFTRSSQDVSLRRLAAYSLSPALKAAFEQIYGPPYLARLLFAELGRGRGANLFLRLEYDGTLHTNGGSFGKALEEFGVISGTAASTTAMEEYLRGRTQPEQSLEDAVRLAAEAWAAGHLFLQNPGRTGAPSEVEISAHRDEYLQSSNIEAAVLDRESPHPVTWRPLTDAEVRKTLEKRS